MQSPLREAGQFLAKAQLRALGLRGRHQVENAAVALATLAELRASGLSIPEKAVSAGLAGVRWPARVELIATRPAVVLDTAHNVPSIEALVNVLHGEPAFNSGLKRVIFAVSSDKDYPAMLQILAAEFDHLYLTQYGDNPRCVAPAKLAAELARVAPGTQFSVHPTSRDAWSTACQDSAADDLICVTGSVFLAGELRPVLTGH
jgi:dihydrofolate synthase/folylpolyglutamate synthase